MIAKITRGSRAGDIGAYLHGPGKANEHVYVDAAGREQSGGQVIASNIGAEGHTDAARWVPHVRAAQQTRPEIKNSVWQTSLRNTAGDRVLSNHEWADVAQTFAERMGFENHPWVAVRHGSDHIHIVVSRVDFEGNVWHARNDRRAAQSACRELEQVHGLEVAPRRKVAAQQTVGQVRAGQRQKVAQVQKKRAQRAARGPSVRERVEQQVAQRQQTTVQGESIARMRERIESAWPAAPVGRSGGLPAVARSTIPRETLPGRTAPDKTEGKSAKKPVGKDAQARGALREQIAKKAAEKKARDAAARAAGAVIPGPKIKPDRGLGR